MPSLRRAFCRARQSRPCPIATLALEAAQAADLLPEQRVPVTVGGQLGDGESAQGEVILVPVAREAAAEVVGGHVDVGSEGGGKNKLAAGFQQALEFVRSMGRLWHMLKHPATEHSIETGIDSRNLSDVADQINPRRVPTFGL